MRRMPLHPASGVGVTTTYKKAIRLLRFGCTNRPFYHIVVTDLKGIPKRRPVVEQIGSYDELPNSKNERLVAFNYERFQHWLGQGVQVSRPVLELLGIGGLLPIHPRTYIAAWRNRAARDAREAEEAKQAQKMKEMKENESTA